MFLNIDVLEGIKNIPSNTIDLIIADPPYYKIVKNYWDNQWNTEKEYTEWCILWIKECERILKDKGNFYLWGGIGGGLNKKKENNALLKLALKISNETNFIRFNWITWKKDRGYGATKNWMFVREELLCYCLNYTEHYFNVQYSNEKRIGVKIDSFKSSYFKSPYKRCSNIWVLREVGDNNFEYDNHLHIAVKPILTSIRIIKSSCPKNGKVFIPFVGSGTDIIVCKKLQIKNPNLDYIGFEKDKLIYSNANRRIENEIYVN